MKQILPTLAMFYLMAGQTQAGPDITAPPSRFEFSLARDASLTSAAITDEAGRLVRTLWAMQPRPAGTQSVAWDGLDDFTNAAPVGTYSLRVVVNGSSYTNVGTLGNTGTPPGEPQHIQHGVLSLALDAAGNIYTANGWEEAGHDFKVQNPDGKTLFHARYQIRNGRPNGAPHALAVDDAFIYCATHGWANDEWKSKQQIQRFRITNGDHVPFTDPALTNSAGHIQLYEWPEKRIPDGTPDADRPMMEKPVQALAVRGDTLYATDCLAHKVHKFHKVTGDKQGEWPVKFPHALAWDAQGRLWVGHEHHKLTAFDADGNDLGLRLEKLGDIRSLSVAPNGQLVLADGQSGQVKFYDLATTPPKLVRSFGGKANPGDFAPDRFYELRGAAMDTAGHLVTIAGVTGSGARLARFAPAEVTSPSGPGRCLWEHLALAFCETGNYAPDRPDEFITQRFHRLRLSNKNAGRWEYRGTVLEGDPKLLAGNHGVMRFVTFGTNQFVYQCYGDGMQIYRRHGELFRLAAMAGGNEPRPDGRFNHDLPAKERQGPGWWSWADENADGKASTNELVWFKPPGQARYALLGMNTDTNGTLLYCDQHTHAIWELPRSGLNAEGNPVYDWRLARQIVAQDKSAAKFDPLMAVRSDDGSLYALGRSPAWERPGGKEAGYVWMGGWALARYDRQHQRLWITRLPEVCPGLCDVPGGRGVMLGYYQQGHVYHYEPGGLLIGVAKLGDAAGNQTGWMDNTAALAVSRDPRDGLLDVFGEDSWLNRIIWYRVNDRDIQTITGTSRRYQSLRKSVQ